MAADHQRSFSSVLNSNFLGWFLANTSATSVSELLPFYFFPGLELNFGTQFPMNFVNSPKELLKNIFDLLLSIMEAEDDYVEVPTLPQKIANSATTT